MRKVCPPHLRKVSATHMRKVGVSLHLAQAAPSYYGTQTVPLLMALLLLLERAGKYLAILVAHGSAHLHAAVAAAPAASLATLFVACGAALPPVDGATRTQSTFLIWKPSIQAARSLHGVQPGLPYMVSPHPPPHATFLIWQVDGARADVPAI